MSDTTDVASPGTAKRQVRACHTCAIAKAKCVPQEGRTGRPCGRCHRLGKECAGQIPSGKHLNRKHTRIEKLEQKIESILAAQSGPAPDRPSLAVPPSAPSTTYPHPTQHITTAEASISHPSRPDCPKDPLEIFHSELAKYCPWVIVPSGTKSADLSQKKPFLYLNICMAASYRDAPRQVELGRKIREHLGSHLIKQVDKSLDLLQGLLVAMTWYHFHMSLSVQLTNMLHLAMAQVVELGLGRRLHASDRQRPAISGLRSLPSYEESHRNQPDSLDGPRAYLGCFYFSSVISICLKKMDPMLWNQRTEECCRLLTERTEYSSDKYLVHQVRLHRIAGMIGQTLPFDEPEIQPGASLQPIRMCVKSFERDLQEFRKSVSVDMTEPGWSMSLVMKFHIVEMYLHEIGFQLPNKGDGSLLRVELLYSCLLSAKAFFNELFSTPATTFINYTYVPWAHVIHALAVLSKLSLLEDADWDLSHVHRVLDFAQVIDQVLAVNKALEAQMVQLVRPHHSTRYDMFPRVASQMTQLKERYLLRLATLEGRGPSQSAVVDESAQMNNERVDGEIFEGLDEFFWQDIIADWNAFPDPGQ